MIGSKGVTDNMSKQEKFEIFKRNTGGKLYQKVQVELTKNNIDYFVDKDNRLVKNIDGSYSYMGIIFKTINKLNKYGYWFRRTIMFDTMLDLVPYLGYIISFMSANFNTEYIEISRYSWPEMCYSDALKYGYERNNMLLDYQRAIQDEYRLTFELEEED